MPNITLWTIIIAVVFFVLVTTMKVFIYLSANEHSTNIKLLRERATIIVRALDQSGLENTTRKTLAVTKLGALAQEFKINLSTDQAADYIEAAVNEIRQLVKPSEIVHTIAPVSDDSSTTVDFSKGV